MSLILPPQLVYFIEVGTVHIGGSASFHRAALLNILVSKIPTDRVHFNKRVISYSYSHSHSPTHSSSHSLNEITLHFADGSTATTDILIGCDGIRSIVRRQMYTTFAVEDGDGKGDYVERFVEPGWSGSLAYRALLPAEPLRKMNPGHPVFKRPLQVSDFVRSSIYNWVVIVILTLTLLVLCSRQGKSIPLFRIRTNGN